MYMHTYTHTYIYIHIILTIIINNNNNMCVLYTDIPLFIYPPFVSRYWDAWFYLNTAPHQLAFGPAPDWKASPGPGTAVMARSRGEATIFLSSDRSE